jgi:hypothetical protein
VIADGNTAHAILEYAAANEVDLIAMSTQGMRTQGEVAAT